MGAHLMHKVGKTSRLEVLQILKRAGRSMGVAEIAQEMGLSYMGTKEVCLQLEKSGFLSTWRHPVPKGRPQLHYRLTQRAEELFPRQDQTVLLSVLRGAERFYGPTAPAKLLLAFFQEQTEAGQKAVRGETVEERLKWMARWRDRSGHFASVLPEPTLGWVERHRPLEEVFAAYPDALRMEEQMLAKVFGLPVQRINPASPEEAQWRFLLPETSANPPPRRFF
jgi:predicted ArsR family transcriptional regulator